MSTRWWLRPPIADTWEDDASSMSSSRDLRQTALLEFMFTATPHSPRARRVQRLSIPSHSFQTSLDSYLHRVRSPPCHLHRLPSEILMDIFCYLPWSSRATRIHVTDPLPIWFDQEDRYYEGGDDDDDSEKAEAGSSYRGTVGRFCILNQLTRDGCDRFCGDYCRWDHLSILRVCRKWYNTAVGCPQFWCRILLHDERFTMRALQLSATLPLSVADIPDGYPLAPSAVLVALTALPRIRELHLPSRLGPDAKMAVLSALLSRPAPSLKLLHVESGYRPLEGAFAGQTPSNLRQLVLLGSIPSSPDATIYAPTITSLQIEGRTPWTTANSICDVLSRMPLLEILILDARATVPDEIHSSSFTPPQQPIMLHNLRRLLLDQPFRAVLNLQQIIQFPPSTSFELCYRHRCIPDPDAERCYLAQLGRYFEAVASDGHVVTRADFLVEYHCDTIELKLSTALSLPQRLPLSFRIQHVWRELADDFLPTLARLMQSTAAAIPTASIADLAIRQHTRTTDLDDSVTKYDAHLWWAFLLSIPAVRRLHLIWEAPKDFLFWLTANGQRAAYAQDVELYFPALEVLAISCCSLNEVAGIIAPVPDGHEDPAATEEQVSVFKLLTEYLQARVRVGRLCLVDVLEQESQTPEVQRMIVALNEMYGEGIVRRHRSLDEELRPLHLS